MVKVGKLDGKKEIIEIAFEVGKVVGTCTRLISTLRVVGDIIR